MRTMYFLCRSNPYDGTKYHHVKSRKRRGVYVTVTDIPSELAVDEVTREVNNTVMAIPFYGPSRPVKFAELGLGRFINLYPKP